MKQPDGFYFKQFIGQAKNPELFLKERDETQPLPSFFRRLKTILEKKQEIDLEKRKIDLEDQKNKKNLSWTLGITLALTLTPLLIFTPFALAAAIALPFFPILLLPLTGETNTISSIYNILYPKRKKKHASLEQENISLNQEIEDINQEESDLLNITRPSSSKIYLSALKDTDNPTFKKTLQHLSDHLHTFEYIDCLLKHIKQSNLNTIPFQLSIQKYYKETKTKIGHEQIFEIFLKYAQDNYYLIESHFRNANEEQERVERLKQIHQNLQHEQTIELTQQIKAQQIQKENDLIPDLSEIHLPQQEIITQSSILDAEVFNEKIQQKREQHNQSVNHSVYIKPDSL